VRAKERVERVASRIGAAAAGPLRRARHLHGPGRAPHGIRRPCRRCVLLMTDWRTCPYKCYGPLFGGAGA
jgi:hypothetical protein